jgi:predicted site-specific integrase-resolvase
MEKDEWVKPGELSKHLNITEETLRSWANAGKIRYIRTPSGRRLYHKQSILTSMGQTTNHTEKKNFLYARVSSTHQKNDLQRQADFLLSRYPTYTLLTDVGSGINFKRKGLRTLLDTAMQGNLGEVVVAHKDRLSRLGWELIEWIIYSRGGILTILDQESHVSREQELAEDLLSIVTVFTCRQNGRRKYKNTTNSSSSESGTEQNIS